MKGSVAALCISQERGVPKEPVEEILLMEDKGIEGDGHYGYGHRQVSLLGDEDIQEMRKILPSISYGAFAENVVTRNVPLHKAALGDRLTLGEALLEVTQIGKECHTKCVIYETAGSCIMPTKGIFCKVLRGGRVIPGDAVEWLPQGGELGEKEQV
jgi:MOSC domain-containing protein YiiM